MGPVFNILAGAALFIIATIFGTVHEMSALIASSYLFAISTLLPIMKNDGYRVLSDIVNVPDLWKTGVSFIGEVAHTKRVTFDKKNLASLVYVVMNIAVILGVLTVTIRLLMGFFF